MCYFCTPKILAFNRITMNITRENIDALNAVVKVEIEKNDYSDKVEKILSDYRKSANIPGFRKGHVPMGMVKKQYGKAVLVDEVNKLLQENLNKFLVEEKIDLLGNPLPKNQDNLNWDADNFSFEFELGLAPEFDVNLKNKKAITHYTIVADEKTIDDQIENIRGQYGKLIAVDEINDETEITGDFSNESEEINQTYTFTVNDIKGKRNKDKFLGSKVGDTLKLKSKNLFDNSSILAKATGKPQEEADNLDFELSFEVKEINKRELADLDQEFYDKLFGKDVVKSEEDLKAKLKEDAEKQFTQQADQKLLNDVTEYLIESTSFDLPQEFLEKWLRVAGEQTLTEEQAKEEYQKSEKGLRYQLIEGKLMADNDIQVSYEDIRTFSKDMIKVQMAQFGQTNPSDEELDNIAGRVLSNQEEVNRLRGQLVSQKLLDFYKDNLNLKAKELNYEQFVKEVYS